MSKPPQKIIAGGANPSKNIQAEEVSESDSMGKT